MGFGVDECNLTENKVMQIYLANIHRLDGLLAAWKECEAHKTEMECPL